MRSVENILKLLDSLEMQNADSMEDQDLDFKRWNIRSMSDAVATVIEMAVCMANGGGGTVVFGVDDQAVGRQAAIAGVPTDVDVSRLKKAVYDGTDPKLTPVFEELRVLEGTGRLIVMQVYPGMPPYTDTAGSGKIRVGKDCQPLTGTVRRRIGVETGETDITALPVEGSWQNLVSALALERLRSAAALEKAPRDLLALTDEEFLAGIGCLTAGRLTRAGLLLCGKEEAIRAVFPAYVWTFLRMDSDTAYSDRIDGRAALPLALEEFEQRIARDNPIRTLEVGLIHAEVRAYPQIAIREALLNALCHADFLLPGPVLVKQFGDRMEISNPGSFIGGISPANILHHPPVPRNPRLVDALSKLRLVNRSNLGIGRMFEAFLIEGKEPPVIQELGETVLVTFLKQDVSAPFRAFVAEEAGHGHIPGVDELLVLQFLHRHSELETSHAAALCQRPEATMRTTLSRMERDLGYLQRGGSGRGTFWTLSRSLAKRLGTEKVHESTVRIDWESAKTRVLSVLKQRAADNEPGLQSGDIRGITHFDRNQVYRLMQELRQEYPDLTCTGHGRGSWYTWTRH